MVLAVMGINPCDWLKMTSGAVFVVGIVLAAWCGEQVLARTEPGSVCRNAL